MASDVLNPMTADEYRLLYAEIYATIKDSGLMKSNFSVDMDTDPTINPKGINEKLAKVQGNKDRLVVIYNRALKNKSYYDTVLKGLQAEFDAEYQKAMLSEDVKKAGNAEMRVAKATQDAKAEMLRERFKGVGTYEQNMVSRLTKQAEANAFFTEIKHIYENLDSTSMNLAIQLKSVMLNARIYGDGFGVEKGGKDGGGSY